LKLEGRIPVAAPPDAVWALMLDPLTLAACVPGVRDVHAVDERTFTGSITAAVGPMNGQFTFTSVITRAVFPDALEVTMEGVDSVTKSRLHAVVTASVADVSPGATDLAYAADVVVKGRLAILGEMVLRATATMMIGQVTRCLRARLEESVPQVPGADAATGA
jgi:carbon monoxide dehydrogenase subunit G